MKDVVGCPGTKAGLVLRIGQCSFAATSIILIVIATMPDFMISCSAISYLVMAMGWQVFWTLGLICVDIFAIKMNKDLRTTSFFVVILVGDWVTWITSLATTSSSGGVIVLYVHDKGNCLETGGPCGMIMVSIIVAFISWILMTVSAHVVFWTWASI